MASDTAREIEARLAKLFALGNMAGDPHRSLFSFFGLLFLKYAADHSAAAATVGGDQSLLPGALSIPWVEMVHDRTGTVLADSVRRLTYQPETSELGQALADLGLVDLPGDDRLTDLCHGLLEINLGSLSPSLLSGLIDRLLERGVEDQGWRGGGYYTPSVVSELLASLLALTPAETVYDPACGTGSLLLAVHRRMSAGQGTAPHLYGQEIQREVAGLARVNMALHGVGAATLAAGDTLAAPSFVEGTALRRFDAVCVCQAKTGSPALVMRPSWGMMRFV